MPPVNKIMLNIRQTNTKQTKHWKENMFLFPIAVPVQGQLEHTTSWLAGRHWLSSQADASH